MIPEFKIDSSLAKMSKETAIRCNVVFIFRLHVLAILKPRIIILFVKYILFLLFTCFVLNFTVWERVFAFRALVTQKLLKL